MADVKEEYEKLKLSPSFKDVDFEFEISSIEHSDFLSRQIVKRMMDRMDSLIHLLTDILQPDTGAFINLYECSYITKEETQIVVALHRKLMILSRALTAADIAQDKKLYASVIKDVMSQWPSIRKDSLPILDKLKTCWEKPEGHEEILEYLG